MDLTCSDLQHPVYLHRLGCEYKIRARSSDDPTAAAGQSRDKESGSLKINWPTAKIRLDGAYSFELTISRDEAATMFIAAYKDAPLDECLEALRKARRTQEQERAEQRRRPKPTRRRHVIRQPLTRSSVAQQRLALPRSV
jgi:hypothetical protein